MTENLRILDKKLDHLGRLRKDVEYSAHKMVGPLQKIAFGDIDALTPDERETVSAFNKRFGDYQEQIGKTMRSIAIEEESPLSPFGTILALMEKWGYWKTASVGGLCANYVTRPVTNMRTTRKSSVRCSMPCWLMSRS